MFVIIESQTPGPSLENMRNSSDCQDQDETPTEFDRLLPEPVGASLPNEVAEQRCAQETCEHSQRETRCRWDPKHEPESPLASRRSRGRRFFQRVRWPGGYRRPANARRQYRRPEVSVVVLACACRPTTSSLRFPSPIQGSRRAPGCTRTFRYRERCNWKGVCRSRPRDFLRSGLWLHRRGQKCDQASNRPRG